jgi:hypothetical protein
MTSYLYSELAMFFHTPRLGWKVVSPWRADKSGLAVWNKLDVMKMEISPSTIRLPYLVCSRFTGGGGGGGLSRLLSHETLTVLPGSLPVRLRPRRDAKQEDFLHRPHPIGQPSCHRWCTGPPAFRRT